MKRASGFLRGELCFELPQARFRWRKRPAFSYDLQRFVTLSKLAVEITKEDVNLDVLGIVTQRFAKVGDRFSAFSGPRERIGPVEVRGAKVRLDLGRLRKNVRGFGESVLAEKRGAELEQALRRPRFECEMTAQ